MGSGMTLDSISAFLITRNEKSSPKFVVDPDPAIRGACFVVTSDSRPHVLPMLAPVRALAPPRTHRLLDGLTHGLWVDWSLSTLELV